MNDLKELGRTTEYPAPPELDREKSSRYEYIDTSLNLRRIFGGEVSKSAFRNIDGEWNLVGKFCRIIEDSEKTKNNDAIFDVWICNHADLSKGLGTKKLGNIIRSLKLYCSEPFHELSGESYVKVQGTESIIRNLRSLGIRAKRKLTPEQAESIRKRLAEGRQLNR